MYAAEPAPDIHRWAGWQRERPLPLSGNSAEQTAIHGIRFNIQERAEPLTPAMSHRSISGFRWPIPRILILKHISPHRDFRRAIKTGSGSFTPNIRIGYSKPKTQVWTGTRLLKMSLCWGATLWPRAVFPPGNPLPTELITGTTVRGPDSTAATGWLPPRISYGITWTPEISWMRRMCSSSSTMNMMPIHRQRRG